MHQALEITEILRSIFQWCGDKSNAGNALVCKSWSDISLDLVWEVITDINVVFGLLGEISTSNKTRYFSRQPTSAEWHRFRAYYAPRVKMLDLINLDGAQQKGMVSLFDTLARLQHSTPMFPNLTSITWRDIDSPGYTHHSTIFMHSGVTQFHLIFHQTNTQEALLYEYFLSVSERMPNIDRLQVEIPHHSHGLFREPLKAVFRDLHSLKSLSIPGMSDISDVMESLSQYPELRSLNFVRMSREDGVERMDLFLAVDAFQHLVSLQINTPYSVITYFLQEFCHFAAKLTSLSVTSTSPQSENPSVVKDLFEVVAERFDGSLRSLHVRIDTQFPPGTLPSPTIFDVVSFHHIEPILRCSKMREFSLTHSLPLDLRHEDVKKMGASWPFIVKINLCVDPRINFPVGSSLDYLGFDSVIPFTEGCPFLETLELPLDPTRVLRSVVDDLSIQCLRHLRVFSPGNVSLPEELDDVTMTMFLSRILPPNCTISFFTNWANPLAEVTPEEWNQKWRDVRKGLVLVEAMRDRMRREAMETIESMMKKRA